MLEINRLVVNLHEITNRATAEKLINYKLALKLLKTFNDKIPTGDWIQLSNNIINTTGQTSFATHKSNSLKVGMNVPSNKLWYLNGKIQLEWLNQLFNSFKIHCKRTF